MRPATRRERRAERQRRYSESRDFRQAVEPVEQLSAKEDEPRPMDYDAPLPGWLRPLDYRLSGESGALVVHSHCLNWHRAKSPNATAPPPGRGWDRSGPIRLVEGLPPKPDTHPNEISN